MRGESAGIRTPNIAEPPQFRETCGEILADGSVIDLISVENELMICRWDGSEAQVVPRFLHGGIVYTPPKMSPSLRRAIKFPAAPVDYGSVCALFNETAAIFEEQDFAQDDAHRFSLTVLATHVPELFSNPPTFLVYGSDLSQAALLFDVLGSLCRRPLTAPELSRYLPFSIRPTLLILSTKLSSKQRMFWRASNYRNVQIPYPGGVVDNFAGPRILFTDDAASNSSWGSNVLRFALLPRSQIVPPTERDLTRIADEFQPKLLKFRLQRLGQMAKTPSCKGQPQRFPNCEVASKLLRCVQDDPEVLKAVVPLLRAQEQETREHQKRDPYRVIVESLWAPSHQSKEMPVSELTKRVNAILHARGEVMPLDWHEVGWKLTHLGLDRKRKGSGMHLRFSRDVRCQLHQLARRFELELPRFVDCPDCKEP